MTGLGLYHQAGCHIRQPPRGRRNGCPPFNLEKPLFLTDFACLPPNYPQAVPSWSGIRLGIQPGRVFIARDRNSFMSFSSSIGVGRLTELAKNFALPITADGAITRERGQDLFVTEVLAPRLELLGCSAEPLA